MTNQLKESFADVQILLQVEMDTNSANLPDPVRPIIPIFSFGSILKLTSSSARGKLGP